MNHVPESGAEKLVTLKNDYPCVLATIISYQEYYLVIKRRTGTHTSSL